MPESTSTAQQHTGASLGDPELSKRILKETARLVEDPVPGILAEPHEDNLRHFNVLMNGPENSPYEGIIILLPITLKSILFPPV